MVDAGGQSTFNDFHFYANGTFDKSRNEKINAKKIQNLQIKYAVAEIFFWGEIQNDEKKKLRRNEEIQELLGIKQDYNRTMESKKKDNMFQLQIEDYLFRGKMMKVRKR